MTYLQFINDARFVGDGVVIGQPGADAKLNANKDAYASRQLDRCPANWKSGCIARDRVSVKLVH